MPQEQTVALLVPQIKINIAVVCQAPKGKPHRDSEEEVLEASTARAREEEDEFFQAVPQHEATKVRQADVYRWRHPEQLEELMRNEGVWVRPEGAG